MKYFVEKDHIVRRIWGDPDTILLVFAGAAAEFSLNKSVDWLYFTGKLPSDPIGRLFSTVSYSQQIVFATEEDAFRAIDQITSIHKNVEAARSANIPNSAYRDVLFMLIDYSIRAHQLIHGKLSKAEKIAIFKVFRKMGDRMEIEGLPLTYSEFLHQREEHLDDNLVYSKFTTHLQMQYKHHLGSGRFSLLKQVQLLLLPPKVKKLLSLDNLSWLWALIPLYKWSTLIGLDRLVKLALLPRVYRPRIAALEVKG